MCSSTSTTTPPTSPARGFDIWPLRAVPAQDEFGPEIRHARYEIEFAVIADPATNMARTVT